MGEPAAEQEFRPGEVIEGFRIEALLGPGGMSSVYRAEDLVNRRTVALKLPAGGSSASEEALLRFRREARLAASIAHPNCVLVYGAHELRGSPAIAMEWVPGGTLQERIAAGTIPIEQAVEWTLQVIDGLEAAWSAGILHRDVKPANCFVGADGEAKVGDFGLSKSFEQASDLTVSGAFLGTPLYASPEQIRGRELDHRSDIYSAGATLYALLIGRPPFGGAQQGEVLARILSEPVPSLREDRPDVSRLLERVVVKAMAKDPGERYQSHAEFRAALLSLGPRVETPAKPAGRIAAALVDELVLAPMYVVWWLLSLAGVPGARMEEGFPAPTVPWSVAIFLTEILYYFCLERAGGASLAKRLFSLRVVGTDGANPPASRILIRSALYPTAFLDLPGEWWLLPPLVVLAPCLSSRTGYRGLHELLSGTRVVRSVPRVRRILRAVRTGSAKAAREPMERVSGLELLREIPSSSPGELFEAYEPALERRVLVHRASSVEAGRSAEMAQRSGLQLLRRIEDSSGVLHVYEAIGGEPLRDRLARGAFERWDEGVELVADLIRACLARRTATRIEELWLDDGGKLRVLDFTGGNDGVGPPLERLITGVGRGALLGRGSGHDYPLDLPLHADPAVQEVLRGPQSRPEQLEQRLRSLLSDDRHPGPRRRILAMLLASGMAYIWLMSSSMSDSFAIATSIAILAFALRDVPVFLLVGLGLRQTDGLRAARWRCGLRTALVWVPIPLALWWGLAQHAKDWPAPLSVSGAVLAVGLLPLAHLVTTLRNPERGLIDALVGTRVVLR